MKKTLLMTALCCAATGVATSASAELTYGNAFAKNYNFDGDGGSADLTALGGGIEYRTGSYVFSGELLNLDADGADLTIGSIGMGYTLRNGVTLGLDYAEFDIEGADAGILSGYAQYSFGAYTLGLSAGDSSDLSDTTYSIYGAWDVSPTGTVGLDVIRLEGETLFAGYADYELAQYSLRADLLSSDGSDLFSISGGYDLGNNFTVIGALAYAGDSGDDITGVSLGGQYEFVPGVNAELAVGRVNFENDHANVLSLGLNYELGRKTNKRRTIGNILSDTSGAAFGIGSF
jgi:hypothetical protein